MSPYPPWRYLLALLVTGLGAGGCLSEELCTPADSTYTCCLKQNPTNPAVCGASEQEAAAALRQALPEKTSGATYRARALAVGGTVTAAATLSSDEAGLPEKLRTQVEQELKHCAELANERVNRKWFGGDPTPAQCEEVLGTDKRGKKITRAMKLGEEKHEEALKCAADKLGKRIPERFSLDQQYRYDPATQSRSLVSTTERETLLRTKRHHELKGTLRPDVVIHTGNPVDVQAVYDFKFPCLRTHRPRWGVYDEQGHPYRDRTQGDVYKEVFGEAWRVTPWEII
jgi:hypothetical protein